MKCGIVTVYNSMNCGSYLQAYALASALEENGHEAVFVQHGFSDHSISRRNHVKSLLRTLLRGRFSAAGRLVRRRKAFQSALCHLKVEKDPRDADCYVFGSDTVWDLTFPYFSNHRDFYWGSSFQNARLISYAPSLGYTGEKELAGNADFVRNALSRFSAVSVREPSGKALLEPYCEKPIATVCDPTFLVAPEAYRKIEKPTELENFIFLYYYGKMPEDYKKEIRAFAGAHDLKTVTFGNSNPWCDLSVEYDPLLFLSLYRKAAYILTNTFHGTVFANIYEKKYVVTKNEKPKVVDLLRACRMSDKMTDKPEDLHLILNSQFDYGFTREFLARERETGIAYLLNALREEA